MINIDYKAKIFIFCVGLDSDTMIDTSSPMYNKPETPSISLTLTLTLVTAL